MSRSTKAERISSKDRDESMCHKADWWCLPIISRYGAIELWADSRKAMEVAQLLFKLGKRAYVKGER